MINGIGNRPANSTDFALGSNIKSDHQNALLKFLEERDA